MDRIFTLPKSIFLCTLIAISILIFFEGTGKEADSISHYLYAKFAFKHPELLLNHWAKPVFTFLAAPFAQMGLIGIKIFNSLCALGTAYFTIRIAKFEKLKLPGLAALFYFIFPLSFLTTFSGLTEPLFALFLTAGIFLCYQQNYVLASLLLSFSPFIRSEGILFIGLFGIYFSAKKLYKELLILFIGHIFLALIGWIYHGNPIWVIDEIPYAELDSPYGSGSFTHFFKQLNGAIGIPLYILFWVGMLHVIIQTTINKRFKEPLFMLLVMGFLCFFLAHTFFWQFGLFNSMGLRRVFAAITPLMALIALVGFHQFSKLLGEKYKSGLQIVLILLIFAFPFSGNRAAVEWSKLNLSPAQQNAVQAVKLIRSKNLDGRRMIYTDPYLAVLFNHDPFDREKRLILSPVGWEEWKSGDLVIWDNWHSVVDYGLELKKLKQKPNLHFIGEVKLKQSRYALFIYEYEEDS